MKEIIEKIGTKKLITITSLFIGVIILTIIGALIYNKFFYKKTYNEIENIMTSATIDYYKDHKSKLPTNIGDSISINANTLISKEYMEDFTEYLKDKEASCEGNINIIKVNKEYRYTPLLECDNNYKTEKLVDKIKDLNPIVTSGNGLYELNNELVYRGEKPNNNILFAGYDWKIVKITDDKIMIILNSIIKDDEARIWDDRYNKEKEEDVGINDYGVSRAYEYLTSLYKGKSLFSSEDKLLISNYDLYIGKRKEEDSDKTGNLEKSNILENQYIGLLPAYDFMNASLDANCNKTDSNSCGNYNYLSIFEKNWWLITGDNANTSKVYKNSNYSNIYASSANHEAYMRPVITIINDAIYVSGNGTTKNPYKFK